MTTTEVAKMSNCTSGCPTQTCESYAACLRGKGTRVAYCDSANGRDATQQKRWDADLNAYRDARAQGIQPASTARSAVDNAVRISDSAGRAWDAS